MISYSNAANVSGTSNVNSDEAFTVISNTDSSKKILLKNLFVSVITADAVGPLSIVDSSLAATNTITKVNLTAVRTFNIDFGEGYPLSAAANLGAIGSESSARIRVTATGILV